MIPTWFDIWPLISRYPVVLEVPSCRQKEVSTQLRAAPDVKVVKFVARHCCLFRIICCYVWRAFYQLFLVAWLSEDSTNF